MTSSNPDDLTFFLSKNDLRTKQGGVIETLLGGRTCCDRVLTFSVNGKQAAWRVHICRAYRGERVSLTARRMPDPGHTRKWDHNVEHLDTGHKRQRGRWPSIQDDKFRATNRRHAQILFDAVQEGRSRMTAPTGLIIVAGRTKSRKSTYARELALLCLNDAIGRRGKRRPHVVTYEDPIEQLFLKVPTKRRAFDYTPRQQGVDTASLEEVTRGALRQTPCLLFAGETRDLGDWRTLLDFAGTGHLALTTTHAGSLVEAMDTVLRSVEANTPAARSHVASKILAIAHLAPIPDESWVLPSLWRRTPIGLDSLTGQGLSSLLPYKTLDREDPAKDPVGSLGRAHFASLFGCEEQTRRKAAELDLRG